MASDAELRAIRDRAEPLLFKIPGVTAVGIGGRERAGRPTGEVVLKVFVRLKRPRDQVATKDMIPSEFEGVPTDVSELGTPELLEAPPPGKEALPDNHLEDDRRRPLVGGSQIQVDLTGAGVGTLGCLLRHTTDANKFYALTCFHVLRAKSGDPTAGITKAGQSTNEDSSTKCCSDIIGTFAGGAKDALRDAGIVQLSPGMTWKAEILEIGVVRGTHTIQVAEAATLTYQVLKRGIKSGLTGGTVQSINTTWTSGGVTVHDAIVVRPNPDPSVAAGTQLYFAQRGDSGSALVNSTSEVVGLVHSSALDPGPGVGQGAAIPIDVVLAQFQAQEAIAVDVATAASAGVVNTVPGSAMVEVPPELVPGLTGAPAAYPVFTPAAAPWLPGIAPPPAGALAGLQADLDASESGRLLTATWLRHHRELLDLVNGNRRVAAVWHRSGGSALLQMLVRMLGQPTMALPQTVNGLPMPACLDRIQQAFARFGSARLRGDLKRLRAVLPDPAGLTYPQIITTLATLEVSHAH